MNRSEIRAAIIAALRETTPPVRWELAELNRYIDDGYRDMAERTGAVVATETVAVAADQNFVDLPTSGGMKCLHVLTVKDVDTDLPVDPVHWTFIDDSVDELWAETSASRPYLFAIWDQKTMLIYPHYAAAGSISVNFAVMPNGLSNDAAEPDVPEEYHDALIHYGVFRCLLKGARGPRLGRAVRQFSMYSERMMGLGEWTNERHEGIFRAIYGQRARVPENVFGETWK